jgi:16S rRNA processing protein RimM
LIGLTAVSPDGETLGEVIAVQNFGAGDLLEIRPARGRQTELVPFESTHVPKVELEEGRLIIIWPDYESSGSAKVE